jgi:hypothetical protein
MAQQAIIEPKLHHRASAATLIARSDSGASCRT